MHYKNNNMEQINLTKPVTIEFTPEQIGLILNIIREQPYKLVADVIAAIQSQVVEQVSKKNLEFLEKQPKIIGKQELDPELPVPKHLRSNNKQS